MKFNILPCALAILTALLSACNSSDSKDSNPTSPGGPDFTDFDDDFNGIANGSITVDGKVIPIEFTASAYAKGVSLTGFTDLAHQDTGWKVFFAALTTPRTAQDIDEGRNQASIAYIPKLDSVKCQYNSRDGTITVESFVAKKSGDRTFFRTSGKVNCILRKSNLFNTPTPCPDLPLQAVFTNVDVYDAGLNQ
jgi:hypothetical protein